MASSRWFCGIVRRKEVRFVVLLLQLGLVGYSSVIVSIGLALGLGLALELGLV